MDKGPCPECGQPIPSGCNLHATCGDRECRRKRRNRQTNESQKRERSAFREGPAKTRVCLRCDQPFQSRGNRLCPKCHDYMANDWNGTEEAAVFWG